MRGFTCDVTDSNKKNKMENAEKWFTENSRKIMDFSDTNEEVISEEKFLEFAEMQASKISSNAVLAVSLPMLKLEYHEIKSDTAYGKFHSWTAELIGVKGMVAESGTRGGAIKELMKSIEVKLLYDMEHRQ